MAPPFLAATSITGRSGSHAKQRQQMLCDSSLRRCQREHARMGCCSAVVVAERHITAFALHGGEQFVRDGGQHGGVCTALNNQCFARQLGLSWLIAGQNGGK